MISEYIVTNVCSDTTRALSRLLLTDVIYIDILDVYTLLGLNCLSLYTYINVESKIFILLNISHFCNVV